MGLLATFAFLRATFLEEIDWVSLSLGTAISAVILYGIWQATRSASAIASEAFHMRWSDTLKGKLILLMVALSLLALGLFTMQFIWTWFLTSSVEPSGGLKMNQDAVAAHLLWLLWPWYLALAALDGLLRGRAAAVQNRLDAEITRAERIEQIRLEREERERSSAPAHKSGFREAPTAAFASHAELSGSTHTAQGDAVISSKGREPNETPFDQRVDNGGNELSTEDNPSATELVSEYRKARAEYESLRRQRDLDLAFLGRRIKDMQWMLRPFHWAPSDGDMKRIHQARKQYEKIVGWFLDQLADALRDVGGGVQAGEVIRRLARSLGIDEKGQLREEFTAVPTVNGGGMQ